MKRVKQVSFGRTVNMGNYESVRFDLVADVGPGESHLDVLETLKTACWEIENALKCAKTTAKRPY